MGRLSKIPELEQRIGKPIYTYLIEAIKEGKKPPDMSIDLGVSKSQVYNLISEYNLKDKLKEAAKLAVHSGDNSELRTIINEFLKTKETGDRSEKTIQNYKVVLENYVRWLESENRPTDLASFNRQNVNDYMYYLKPTTKASSRKSYRTVMLGFDNWLYNNEYRDNTFMQRVEKFKVPKRLPEDLPDEMLKSILNSFEIDFEGVRNRTIIMMFVSTGMRLAGIDSLNFDTFDLETGRGNIIEKGNKERVIRLSSDMIAQLKKYLELREPIARTNKMWVSKDGTDFGYVSISWMVRRLNDIHDPELRRIHPHIFRHCWAKRLAQKKVDIRTMMELGGWVNFQLVLHYSSAYTAEDAWEEIDRVSPIKDILGEPHDDA